MDIVDIILNEYKLTLNEKWITRLIPKTDESKQRLKYMIDNPDIFSEVRINTNGSYSINIQNENSAFKETKYIGNIFKKYFNNGKIKLNIDDGSDCEYWFIELSQNGIKLKDLENLANLSKDKIVIKWSNFLNKIGNFYSNNIEDEGNYFTTRGIGIGMNSSGVLSVNNWHYGVSSGIDHTVEIMDDDKVLKSGNYMGSDISDHIETMKKFPLIFPKVIKNNKGKAEIERLDTKNVMSQIKYIENMGKKNNIDTKIEYYYEGKIDNMKKLFSITKDETVKNWLEFMLNIKASGLNFIDWKDDNIGIDKNGKPKLLDF